MNDNLVKDKKSASMHMYTEVTSQDPFGRNIRCMEKFETDQFSVELFVFLSKVRAMIVATSPTKE